MTGQSAGTARATAILLRAAACRNGIRAGTLLIDNEDGAGPQDYSHAVLGDGGISIVRTLNESSRCVCDVLIEPGGLPIPVRRARVAVKGDDGGTLFTGYLATEPVREFVGSSRVFRAKLDAVSDEWLLDKIGPATPAGDGFSLGLDVRQTLENLTKQYGSTALAISPSGAATSALGMLAIAEGARWSVQAGEAATCAYATYRALDGTITVQPAGAATHELNDADGTLSLDNFRVSQMRELANDVTVSGEIEPTAYVTEVFEGDGLRTEFALSQPAFRPTKSALLQDGFGGESVDTRQWFVDDPGGHLSITSAGLTMNGGSGVDGDVTLTALSAVEMGGSVLMELRGVKLAANSEGMLAGMYAGDTLLANCFAGYRVRQSGGATVLVPVLNGVEVGTPLTIVNDHRYTLRVRLHCAEVQRVMQRFHAMVDGVVQTFGNMPAVSAAMDVVFDLLDEGQSSADPATVLYDSAAAGGAVALTPATCVFAVMNAGQLFGSIGSVSVTRPSTVWVEGTLPNGTKQTRLIGGVYQGVDCSVSAAGGANGAGAVTFFPGRVPQPGELIHVRYRSTGRAIARVADAGSVAVEATAGVPGTSRWLGEVLQPPARSSADCESAAQAILAFSTSRTAALAGTYTWLDPAEDVWPGDVLRVTVGGTTTALLVRSVAVDRVRSVSGGVRFRIGFANDWGTQWKDGLGLRLSESIASDVALPSEPRDASTLLASLSALQVVSVNDTTITFDTGVDAPNGGGFEVRRRDVGFGNRNDGDLVLLSPVRTFSIPRVAPVERYFVRMYDGSAPVRYSRFSAAVFVNVPVE